MQEFTKRKGLVMDIKRFNPGYDETWDKIEMEENDEGEFVFYSEYEKLQNDLAAATKLNEHYLKLVQAQHEEIACLGERLKFWEDRGRACESNLEQLEQDFDNLENKSGMATSFLG
jgi:hypothetical protein